LSQNKSADNGIFYEWTLFFRCCVVFLKKWSEVVVAVSLNKGLSVINNRAQSAGFPELCLSLTPWLKSGEKHYSNEVENTWARYEGVSDERVKFFAMYAKSMAWKFMPISDIFGSKWIISVDSEDLVL
jgi:hypothetical protein